jgi:hypothetical protein
MSEWVELRRDLPGTRLVLPCGHQWTMPRGLPPEAAVADLLQHESMCDLDPGLPVLEFHQRGSPLLASAGEVPP